RAMRPSPSIASRYRDRSHQPKASERDRGRGSHRSHRGPVVAVFAHGAQSEGAFRRESVAHLAKPRRRARSSRPLVAGERQSLSEVLERSGEREKGVFWGLLLLEGRTAYGLQRAAAGGDGGDPDRVRRSRIRLLDNSSGEGPKSE